ncbi:MAG: ornithine aminomutase subunit alpha [Terrisporobacter othiniensis]|uniref:ornithine aminomutase subunit alpha n=1 Tax=Terrisporobacter petrolearius TaxID=1460447 RepID=UPI0022E3DAB9|nr:ornithine aminomutase subunit alpha [Terrisporobacter petrolearius]MDU4860309.1 ornithine aminomutase subunit alpha [Terrisporobacter othiniensis]MDU6993462.1 ornithine aminomutase subunit alpha [Terrisporobacter othiniensis]
MEKRQDDFEVRRKHLQELSDQQLKDRFWQLASQIVDPMVELGRKNTTPSIERSILLRMGFSSLEVKPILEGVMERGLIGKGAGHVVYKLATNKGITVREAGVMLINGEGWDEVIELFHNNEKPGKEVTVEGGN